MAPWLTAAPFGIYRLELDLELVAKPKLQIGHDLEVAGSIMQICKLRIDLRLGDHAGALACTHIKAGAKDGAKSVDRLTCLPICQSQPTAAIGEMLLFCEMLSATSVVKPATTTLSALPLTE